MYHAMMLQKGILNRDSYHVVRVHHEYCIQMCISPISVCALKRDELLVRRDGVVCKYEGLECRARTHLQHQIQGARL